MKHLPVFLIGFMGSGKSTVGQALARRMELSFCDLDDYISEKSGKSPAEWIERSGEEFFRTKEQKYLIELIENQHSQIISCGGGTPCFFDNLEKMKSVGLIIYLKVSIPELVKRLEESRTQRPLLKNISQIQLPLFIEKMLNKREQFYKQANLIVDGDEFNLDRIIQTLQYFETL